MKEFLRPEASVLPDSALVPANRLVEPAPNRFTHRLADAAEYWYAEPADGMPSAGALPAGTDVVLMRHDGGRNCWVVDGRGLYVNLPFAFVRRL